MLTAQRRATTAALILTGSLLLTSCGGSSDNGSSDAKTLKLWHYEGPDSAMGVAWNEAIKEFEAQHPGVKVKFEEKGFEPVPVDMSEFRKAGGGPKCCTLELRELR